MKTLPKLKILINNKGHYDKVMEILISIGYVNGESDNDCEYYKRYLTPGLYGDNNITSWSDYESFEWDDESKLTTLKELIIINNNFNTNKNERN